MNRSKPYAGTQAILRAISVLKTFDDGHAEWSVGDLARQVALNKTTVYRLLTALESEGVVARNPVTGAFRLGPTIIALGGVATRSNDLRRASIDELQRLAKEVGEAATLEVLVGDEVLIVEEVPSARLVSSSQSVGTRHPAHATSTGKVLLSDLNEDECRHLLSFPLRRMTELTITDWDTLVRELEAVRARGYATALEELEVGYAAVSAAVRNHHGRVAAAICLGGPVSRVRADLMPELAERLEESARRVSQRLGFNGSEIR